MRKLMLPASVISALSFLPAAQAKTELKCDFQGSVGTVTIVNTENKRMRCHYSCQFGLENGAGASAGSIGVAAGETKKVTEKTFGSKVLKVNDSKLECE